MIPVNGLDDEYRQGGERESCTRRLYPCGANSCGRGAFVIAGFAPEGYVEGFFLDRSVEAFCKADCFRCGDADFSIGSICFPLSCLPWARRSFPGFRSPGGGS